MGAILREKYRLDRVVGVGGMATVYAATHRNGRRVAVKILHGYTCADPEVRARFVREGYVANAVSHPGVVQVIDDDVSEDSAPFVVMELLEGETVSDRWERCGKTLPLEEVIDVALHVLDVLVAAHAREVVHRDLKPENLFRTRDGAIKVLDFGIARLRDSMRTATQSGRSFGTPGYMSPEQTLGKNEDVDGRTDLWALGATMFMLLTRRFVHDAETPLSMAVQCVTRHPVPVRSIAPEVPPAIAAVIDRALKMDRAVRWSTATEMRAALRTARDGLVATHGMPRMPSPPPGDDDDLETRVFARSHAPLDSSPPWHRPASGQLPTLPPNGARSSPAKIAGVVALFTVFILAGAALARKLRDRSHLPVVAAAAASGASSTPAAPRTVLPFLYSSEKEHWLEENVVAFEELHPDVDVQLVSKGSLDATTAILSGAQTPVLWSPADRIAVEKLSSSWKRAHGSDVVVREGDAWPRSLLLTPLVFVTWESRARTLLDGAPTLTWKRLQQLAHAPNGWASLGGDADWGVLKLGHTDPTSSNSGLQTLVVMAYGFYERDAIDADDARASSFASFARALEARRVAGAAQSTGAFTTDFVRAGPSTYDVALTYEAAAIEAMPKAARRWEPLRVMYPEITVWSDHPLCLLDGAWVTNEQRAAARELATFLSSKEAQQRAVRDGFRPASLDAAVVDADPSNPFYAYRKNGVKVEVARVAGEAKLEVIEELLKTYRSVIDG